MLWILLLNQNKALFWQGQRKSKVWYCLQWVFSFTHFLFWWSKFQCVFTRLHHKKLNTTSAYFACFFSTWKQQLIANNYSILNNQCICHFQWEYCAGFLPTYCYFYLSILHHTAKLCAYFSLIRCLYLSWQNVFWKKK